MAKHRLAAVHASKSALVGRLAPFIGAALVVATGASAIANHYASAESAQLVSIYPNRTVPVTAAEDDSRAVELGVRFSVSQPGAIVGLRYFKSAQNTGAHVGTLWNANGVALASATFTGESVTGWQHVEFASAVTLTPGAAYVASYHTSRGYYAQQQWTFSGGATLGNKVIRGTQGLYRYGSGGFPTQTWHGAAYYVDVLFKTSDSALSGRGTTTSWPTQPTQSQPSTPASSPMTSSRVPWPSASKRSNPPIRTAPASPAPASAPSSSQPAGASSSASAPAASFPTAATTGISAGTVLKKMGSITVNTAGTVIQNAEIDGCVTLGSNADNVVIKNSLIRSNGCIWLVLNDNGGSNLTITDSELDGQNNTSGDAAVAGRNYTLERVNIHGTVDGAKLGDNVTVRDSYIHDLAMSSSSHNDGLQSLGSVNVNLQHNTIITPAGGTSAIILSTGSAPAIRNVTINDNLLAGGAYTVYGGYQQGVDTLSKVSNILIENNRFSTQIYPKCGAAGPLTSDNPPAVTVTGNTWYDGPNKGKAVS